MLSLLLICFKGFALTNFWRRTRQEGFPYPPNLSLVLASLFHKNLHELDIDPIVSKPPRIRKFHDKTNAFLPLAKSGEDALSLKYYWPLSGRDEALPLKFSNNSFLKKQNLSSSSIMAQGQSRSVTSRRSDENSSGL